MTSYKENAQSSYFGFHVSFGKITVKLIFWEIYAALQQGSNEHKKQREKRKLGIRQ